MKIKNSEDKSKDMIEAFLKYVKSPRTIFLYVIITVSIPIPYLLCRSFNIPYSFYFISLSIGFLTKRVFNYIFNLIAETNEFEELFMNFIKKFRESSPKAHKFIYYSVKIKDFIKK